MNKGQFANFLKVLVEQGKELWLAYGDDTMIKLDKNTEYAYYDNGNEKGNLYIPVNYGDFAFYENCEWFEDVYIKENDTLTKIIEYIEYNTWVENIGVF